MRQKFMPENEKQRIEELLILDPFSYDLKNYFNHLLNLACEVCELPIAFISVITDDQQQFLAKKGIDHQFINRDLSICSETIRNNKVNLIPNINDHKKLINKELVSSAPHIISYAGIPLKTSNGYNIGTFVVADTKHHEFNSTQVNLLNTLATQVITMIESEHKNKKINQISTILKQVHDLNIDEQSESNNIFKNFLIKGADLLKLENALISKIQNQNCIIEESLIPGMTIEPGTLVALNNLYSQLIIDSKDTFFFSSNSSYPNFHFINKEKMSSYIGTPIYYNNTLYGVLSFCSKKSRDHDFTPEEIKFVEILAQIISKTLMRWMASQNITELTRQLNQEKEEVQFIKNIIDESPGYISISAAEDSSTLYFNKALGLIACEEVKNGQSLNDYYPGWVKKILNDEGIPYAFKNNVWKGESAFLDKFNNEVPVLKTLISLKDKTGVPKYLSTIMQDISPLKSLEKEVSLNKERLNLAVKSANIGIWDWEIKTDKLIWNQTMYEIYGLTDHKQNINFDKWLSLINPLDKEFTQQTFESALSDATDLSTEFRITKDSKTHYIRAEGKVFKNADGKPIRMLGAHWDVTQEKMHEIELQESLARFKTLAELAPVGIILTDDKGNASYVNERWLELTGMKYKDAMGLGWIQAIDPEDKNKVFDTWTNAAKKRDDFELEIRFQNKSTGKISIVESRGTPLFNQHQKVFGYIGVSLDITKQKHTENILIKAKEEAQKASNAKSLFLANMSHEIRTPLNSIVGLSSLLAQSVLDEEQRKYVTTLESSSEILLSIVNDILDLSKIEAGELKLDELQFDFEDLFDKVTQLFSWQVQEKRVNLYYHIDRNIKNTFIGDPTRINQIMINLIGNALKFTIEGSVKFTLTLNNLPNKKGNLLIKVEDTGIGIAKDKQIAIFDVFSQAETSTTRKFGGTGLGLAITKKLVHHMGGEIWVESSEGHGSTFYLTLELEVAAQKLKNRIFPTFNIQKINALLIAENTVNSGPLLTTLESWDIKAWWSDSMEKAEIILKQQNINLILINSSLTEISGPEVVHTIKNNFHSNSYKYILFHNAEEPTEFLNTDFDIKLIPMPYEKRTLYNTICDLLKISQKIKFDKKQISVPENFNQLDHLSLRILLVDDTANNRNLVTAYLKKFPFKIIHAENGQQALDLMKKEDFDLVFMDMQMPIMDGYTATKKFRKWEKKNRKKRLPIIALTAYALQEEQEKSFNAGCDIHLSKPLKKDVLLKTIASLFSKDKISA